MSEATLATFSVYVDGELVDSEALVAKDGTLPPQVSEAVVEIAERQGDLCAAAEQHGVGYLVEIAWRDGTYTRWGTDVDGMVVPVEVGLEGLEEALRRNLKGRCPSTKIGYVCQRGDPHVPPDQHAQLLKLTPDGKLRVAIWVDGEPGVTVKSIDAVAWAPEMTG